MGCIFSHGSFPVDDDFPTVTAYQTQAQHSSTNVVGMGTTTTVTVIPTTNNGITEAVSSLTSTTTSVTNTQIQSAVSTGAAPVMHVPEQYVNCSAVEKEAITECVQQTTLVEKTNVIDNKSFGAPVVDQSPTTTVISHGEQMTVDTCHNSTEPITIDQQSSVQTFEEWEDHNEQAIQCSNQSLNQFVIERQRRASTQEILFNLSSYQFPSPTLNLQANDFEFGSEETQSSEDGDDDARLHQNRHRFAQPAELDFAKSPDNDVPHSDNHNVSFGVSGKEQQSVEEGMESFNQVIRRLSITEQVLQS